MLVTLRNRLGPAGVALSAGTHLDQLPHHEVKALNLPVGVKFVPVFLALRFRALFLNEPRTWRGCSGFHMPPPMTPARIPVKPENACVARGRRVRECGAVKQPPTVKIVQPLDQSAVATEVIAEAIVSISQGIKKLLAGPLNEKALLLLITHTCPQWGRYPKRSVGQREVKAVLEGIQSLEKQFLKPKKS